MDAAKRGFRTTLVLMLLCGIGIARAGGEPSQAAPIALETRVGVHDGYGRIVFEAVDGAAAPKITATLHDKLLTVEFDRSVTIAPALISRTLDAYLSDVVWDPSAHRLTARTLKPGILHAVDLKPGLTAIDISDEKETPTPLATKSAATPSSALNSPPPRASTSQAKPAPPETAKAHEPMAAMAPPVVPAPAAQLPSPQPSPPLPAAQPRPVAETKPALPLKPISEVAAAPPPLVSPIAVSRAASAAASQLRPTSATIAGGLVVTGSITDAGIPTYRFEWAEATAATVFRRDNVIWIAFDRQSMLDLSAVQSIDRPFIVSFAQLPTKSGTVARIVTSAGAYPWVRRAGTVWVIELRPDQETLPSPIRSETISDDGGQALILPALDPAGPISVIDPDAGDVLVFVPLPELGQGIEKPANFPDFRLFASTQGVALLPRTDQLTVRQQEQKIEITGPGGLVMSSASDRALVITAPKLTGQLLTPSDWQGPAGMLFTERERVLLNAIVSADPINRNNASVDLAKFYFSHGLAAEALGVLRTVERDVPNLTDDPIIRLVQGACEIMMGERDLAAGDLGDPSLDGRADTALWRAAVAADGGDWISAATLASQGKDAIPTYPAALSRKLALVAGEALFRVGRRDDADELAQLVLDRDPTPGQRDEARMLQGRVLGEKGDIDGAMAVWEALAKSPTMDQARAQAGYALAVTRFESGKATLPDTIAALDRLRYAWRGGEFEVLVLRKLAELYGKDADYRAAFMTLRKLPEFFPDSQAAKDALSQMRATFVDLFLGPNAEKSTPLTALGLYDEFKELVPSTPEGDEIIRKLADRLVKVDLLERAGGLLEDQVHNRLTGIDQARVVGQLALVRLMDHQPVQALAALDTTAKSDIPLDLARQQTELRARALSDLDKTDEALKVLEGDDSADGDKLRADIFTKSQQWPKLAALLQKDIRMTGDDTLDPDNAATVLRAATALVLANDRTTLAAFTQRYGAAMAKTGLKDAFGVIANGDDGAKPSFETLTAQVGQISDSQSFMSGYRQRLQQVPLSSIN